MTKTKLYWRLRSRMKRYRVRLLARMTPARLEHWHAYWHYADLELRNWYFGDLWLSGEIELPAMQELIAAKRQALADGEVQAIEDALSDLTDSLDGGDPQLKCDDDFRRAKITAWRAKHATVTSP
jgi:hypothetical protein